jgi:hypothetical protein
MPHRRRHRSRARREHRGSRFARRNDVNGACIV